MKNTFKMKRTVIEEIGIGDIPDEIWRKLVDEILKDSEFCLFGKNMVIWTDWSDDKYQAPLIKIIKDAIVFYTEDGIGKSRLKDILITLKKAIPLLEKAIAKFKPKS